MSDLHLEFGGHKNFQLPEVERDVLILAGDIGVGKGALEFIREQVKQTPVIYILGNHEFYRNEVIEVLHFWKTLDIPNLIVLDNSSVSIEGITFFGCVLWTDFDKQNIEAMNLAHASMNDFRTTTYKGKKFIPSDAYMLHQESLQWLNSALLKETTNKTVVITHHIPSLLGIHQKYRESELKSAFYSDLDDFILITKPNLWIHGHTHETTDFLIGGTRIICNPRGYYPSDLNGNFKSDLILEI